MQKKDEDILMIYQLISILRIFEIRFVCNTIKLQKVVQTKQFFFVRGDLMMMD